MLETIVGFLGSITSASLFFPQVWRSYKIKKTQDIAWSMVLLGMLNGVFWIIYGLSKADPFIYVTNAILFLGALILSVLKRKYDNRHIASI